MTGRPRLCPPPSFLDASGRSAALLVFFLIFALAHPSPALCATRPDDGLAPDRVLAAQAAAPMDRETPREAPVEDADAPHAPPAAFGAGNPLSRGVLFLKELPPSQDMAIRAKEAFNRLLVRILSPLSRRSWG